MLLKHVIRPIINKKQRSFSLSLHTSRRSWLTNYGRLQRVQIVYAAMVLSNRKCALKNFLLLKVNQFFIWWENGYFQKTQ